MSSQKKQTFLWKEVFHKLKDKIQTDEFPSGAILPSEKQLEENFTVSRITIRKALTELSQTGIIHSKKGLGWIVGSVKSWDEVSTKIGIVASPNYNSMGFYQGFQKECRRLQLQPELYLWPNNHLASNNDSKNLIIWLNQCDNLVSFESAKAVSDKQVQKLPDHFVNAGYDKLKDKDNVLIDFRPALLSLKSQIKGVTEKTFYLSKNKNHYLLNAFNETFWEKDSFEFFHLDSSTQTVVDFAQEIFNYKDRKDADSILIVSENEDLVKELNLCLHFLFPENRCQFALIRPYVDESSWKNDTELFSLCSYIIDENWNRAGEISAQKIYMRRLGVQSPVSVTTIACELWIREEAEALNFVKKNIY